ncbi:pyridoxal phosphate-dependent aminotransferase [Notoacmeibacter sp. MSK16QG-6]|uniref:pyridoxal phosphate-dependent aminotransferase n=1 Tax=Notoacmeibacter sp. MSK16QG-6 TaxID=2957982 RepID=UPI0020A116EB|nr:aminotransferase class I/II-fold pyridoxal phosphate-dependent enzyme [Notoacmeibacter sp. MSK16QG-6]MCP1197847.1 aminotransferase class I/II-fold pyridoxal phosphate-dependent enzyme [Notoacmeibacter sp. MSK16QG-6]
MSISSMRTVASSSDPLHLSRRAGLVEPFHAMDVFAAAGRARQAGVDVISLAVGQPADPAPRGVREAAISKATEGRLSYTNALGLDELRQAIAQHYRDSYGVVVSPARIAVTSGSSAGFNLAFLSLFDHGDRVAITRPGYPAYRNILSVLGLEVEEISTAETGYLTADSLREVHGRKSLKGLLFASPANPTGASMPEEALRELVDVAAELGIALISDEIYHRLNYTGPDITAAAFSDDVVIINSFSKYYCMTGWRIGWMVLPENLVRPVERVAQSLYISAPEISQIAACQAFQCTEELDAIRLRYQQSRELMMDALPRLGLPLLAPMDGAFYAYCDISAYSEDSQAFARTMLEQTGVAASTGIDFDPIEGHKSLRFSYCEKPERVAEAMERLKEWLNAGS